MERDCLIAHGARGWLYERFCAVSDVAKIPICSGCGTLAILNSDANRPYAHCELCHENSDITVVNAPTSFRLLYQYNAAMGIKMAMRTGSVSR
jgi:DNA-directed RNA polymerase II subunit RPB2